MPDRIQSRHAINLTHSVGGKINVRYSPYNARILFLFDYVAVF